MELGARWFHCVPGRELLDADGGRLDKSSAISTYLALEQGTGETPIA